MVDNSTSLDSRVKSSSQLDLTKKYFSNNRVEVKKLAKRSLIHHSLAFAFPPLDLSQHFAPLIASIGSLYSGIMIIVLYFFFYIPFDCYQTNHADLVYQPSTQVNTATSEIDKHTKTSSNIESNLMNGAKQSAIIENKTILNIAQRVCY